MACNLPARLSVSCGCRSLRAPQPARARPRASRRARVSALQTTERRGDAPGGPAAPLASTDAPDSIFLEEELVGAYSFTEAHIKRFSALHATMQQCGWSFIVVAGATVLGVVAKARPLYEAGILALVYKMGHRPGHFHTCNLADIVEQNMIQRNTRVALRQACGCEALCGKRCL